MERIGGYLCVLFGTASSVGSKASIRSISRILQTLAEGYEQQGSTFVPQKLYSASGVCAVYLKTLSTWAKSDNLGREVSRMRNMDSEHSSHTAVFTASTRADQSSIEGHTRRTRIHDSSIGATAFADASLRGEEARTCKSCHPIAGPVTGLDTSR